MSRLLDLGPLLNPRSIAIIGATPDATRVGGRPLAFLRRYGFEGTIYPVNPRYQEIGELPCYPDVASLPETPEMAIVALPAAAVVEVIGDCNRRGVPAATIYTSGFSEIGAEGKALEAELRAAAGEMVICGPNCQGVANFHDRVVSNWTSALGRDDMVAGPIGFVSQSGLFGGLIAAKCIERGLGLGYLVSSGNEVVLDFADVLAHMAADPRIEVVAGYLEGVRDGRKLEAAAEVARANDKPIVLLKVGRVEESARAAASHTGSMTGAYEVYRAAFRQWGIIEVDDIEELVDVTEVFARRAPRPKGDRVGILTNSGGIGVFCADKVREAGLRLAEFEPRTVAAITEHLPTFGAALNPVDVTLQTLTDPDAVGRHIEHMMRDDGVDAVVTFFGVQWLKIDEVVAMLDRARWVADKPLVVSWGQGDPEAPRRLRELGIPAYDDPLKAIKAVRALRALALNQSRPAIDVAPVDSAEAAAAAVLLRERLVEGPLDEAGAKAVLEAAGLAVARRGLATSEAAATELILGLRRDPTFGPVLLLGTGGVFVETLGDAVLGLLPLDRGQAVAMVQALRSYPMLQRARGRAEADIEAVVEALLKLAALALAAPEIQELDINPLIVRAAGHGAVAADALIRTEANREQRE